MTASVEKGRAVDTVYLDLARHLTLSSITQIKLMKYRPAAFCAALVKATTMRLREVILLLSPGETHLEFWV